MRSNLCYSLLVVCLLFYSCKRDKPSCTDGILNQSEAQADCGGPCKACATCIDGIQNQGEAAMDCGGPCPACVTCSDGLQNQGEENVDCGGPCNKCPVHYPVAGKWGSSVIRPDSINVVAYVQGPNASYYSLRAEIPKGNKVVVEFLNTTVGSNSIWYYYPAGVEGWNIDTYDYVSGKQLFTAEAVSAHVSCDLQMYFAGSGSATIKVTENNSAQPVRVRQINW